MLNEFVQTGSEFPELPKQWQPVITDFIKLIESGKAAEYFGVKDNSTMIRAYHGTTTEKLDEIINSGGMKSFFEREGQEPAIFVTPSPFRALEHVIKAGPHDTLNKSGLRQDNHQEEDARLLLIEMPVDLLTKNEEATQKRRSQLSIWVRQSMGLPDNYTNLDRYISGVNQDILNLEKGQNANSFGTRFPVNWIPLEYIFVIDHQGKKTPLTEFKKS